MELIMYIVIPAMFFAGVGLTETVDARTPLWFVGYASVAVALALFFAQVILCNIQRINLRPTRASVWGVFLFAIPPALYTQVFYKRRTPAGVPGLAYAPRAGTHMPHVCAAYIQRPTYKDGHVKRATRRTALYPYISRGAQPNVRYIAFCGLTRPKTVLQSLYFTYVIARIQYKTLNDYSVVRVFGCLQFSFLQFSFLQFNYLLFNCLQLSCL